MESEAVLRLHLALQSEQQPFVGSFQYSFGQGDEGYDTISIKEQIEV